MRSLFLAFLLALLAPALAAGQTIERIKESGVIRFGVRADAKPFSYRTESGGASGYMVDLCVAVADRLRPALGMETLTADFVTVTAEDRFQQIRDGKIDLLCEATSATLSRREIVDFSLPTYIDGAGVLLVEGGPGSFEELAGHKVGVLDGTTTEETLGEALEHFKVTAELVRVATHDEGLAKLKAGEIAAYFADRTILQFMVLNEPVPHKLRLAERYFTYEPYALALTHGDSAFRLEVDRALSHIYRSKEVEKIFIATFGEGKPSDALRYLYVITGLPD